MSTRLPTGLIVGALRRRVEEAGGGAMVLAKGDERGGAVLVVMISPDEPIRIMERGLGATGTVALIDSTPTDGDVESYWRRRRSRDPDLWVIELDIPQAERFVAETILVD